MLIDNNIRKAKLVKFEFGKTYDREEIEYYLLSNNEIILLDNVKNIDIFNIRVNIKNFQNEEIERLLEINARLYRERDELEEKNKKLNMELLNYQEMTRLEKLVFALCM